MLSQRQLLIGSPFRMVGDLHRSFRPALDAFPYSIIGMKVRLAASPTPAAERKQSCRPISSQGVMP